MSKWLKYGLIFGTVYIFLSLVVYVLIGNDTGDMGSPIAWITMLSGIPILYVWAALFSLLPKAVMINVDTLEGIDYLIVITLILPQYFLLGALIGGIVGKIKKKLNKFA